MNIKFNDLVNKIEKNSYIEKTSKAKYDILKRVCLIISIVIGIVLLIVLMGYLSKNCLYVILILFVIDAVIFVISIIKNNKKLKEVYEYSYEITDDFINIKSNDFGLENETFKYDDFYKIKIIDNIVIFYVNSSKIIYLDLKKLSEPERNELMNKIISLKEE